MSFPILYEPTEVQFDHNGLGILTDCASCEVTEEANGIFELSIQYPVDGIHIEDISCRSIIKADFDKFRNPQLFRVYAISRAMFGMVAVSAHHISYDLSGVAVSPFSADNIQAAIVGLNLNSVGNHNFGIVTDKETESKFTLSKPTSFKSCLSGSSGSILDVYGGEFEFDNYVITLHNKRGENRGVYIRYGKNLIDFQQELNCSNVATGVYPYWFGEVDEVEVLVELPEKVINSPGTYNFERIIVLDFSGDFETQPTIDQLRSRTETYMEQNDVGIPKVSLSVAFAQLEQSEEYKRLKLLERVSLFDEVNVEFPAFRVSTTAKVVEIIYNVLENRIKSITLGSVKTNIADTIANLIANT